MKTLVLGASGATGRLVVQQLADRKIGARVIVRESAAIPQWFSENGSVEIMNGNIDELGPERIMDTVRDCDAIVCCLGHTINFRGMFLPPRKLVYNAVVKITRAMRELNRGQRLVLMGTTAYTNRSLGETNTFGERIIFSLLELLLAPHKDNMRAADHLVYTIGSDSAIDWVAVRPDSLFDEEAVTEYGLHDTKTRSPIFDPGKTSRINVAHFMTELLVDDRLWGQWRHRTPVIYNT